MDPQGATALVVTTAREMALEATPTPNAAALLDAACDEALACGASRVLLWQAEGRVPVGGPVAIAGAAAAHRKDALAAVDALLMGLKGVAKREDVA